MAFSTLEVTRGEKFCPGSLDDLDFFQDASKAKIELDD